MIEWIPSTDSIRTTATSPSWLIRSSLPANGAATRWQHQGTSGLRFGDRRRSDKSFSGTGSLASLCCPRSPDNCDGLRVAGGVDSACFGKPSPPNPLTPLGPNAARRWPDRSTSQSAERRRYHHAKLLRSWYVCTHCGNHPTLDCQTQQAAPGRSCSRFSELDPS